MSLADQLPPFPEPPLAVAVSECLIGGEVRYDGGHKRSSLPHDRLEGLFSFRPICPEVGIGLGVPRDVIRLVGPVQAPRAQSAVADVTDRLASYAREQLPVLDDVDGYVFMKGSPSCGLFRVRVFAHESAAPSYDGRGIYAGEIARARPELPVEESGRLFDAVLRENFVTRTFVHAHWRKLREDGVTPKGLIAFHSAYKFLVMAHSVPSYQSLGRLLADLSGDLEAIAARYFSELMRSLTTPASRGGHANVLSHLQGYVKREMASRSRQELAALIESYRRGEVPLLAPLSLLKHHLAEHDAIYALSQLYLQPHPQSAALRKEL